MWRIEAIVVLFCLINGIIASLPEFNLRSDHQTASGVNLLADNESFLQHSTAFLEPINGSKVLRMHGKVGKEETKWFEGLEKKHFFCVLPVSKCVKLRFTTCFGTQLPYDETSQYQINGHSQEQTMDQLEKYRALRYVPKCWAVIQPFLCATFMPKCDKIGNQEYVFLPSYEMCRITVEPCRLLYNSSFFPDFLKCNETMYHPKCKNDVREMKFNSTGQCMKPLVSADSSANFYPDIDGCGVQCKDPLYTEDEHRQIQKQIFWCASGCLVLNVFVIFTFLFDWKSTSKYPALIIFYINVCSAMCCLGWLAQFTVSSREDIVCKKDGTLRHSEPSAGENLSCIVVFVIVYYFIIAAMVWFVIFTYAWHVTCKVIGKVHDRIDKKGSYFHLVAWSLPLVLTITIMALSEVDGSGVVGICFVGYRNHTMRLGFVLGPIIGVLIVGGYFIIGGLVTLVKLKITSKEVMKPKWSKKIRGNIVRMGLCLIFLLVFILATIVCHIHDFKSSEDWTKSVKNYIICKIMSSYEDSYEVCKMNQRPSVAVLQLHLLCPFAFGIIMSTWAWTRTSWEIWKRCIKRKIGRAKIDPPFKQKHQIIAQAYAMRQEFKDYGRCSLNFHNSHIDPVGLNFSDDCTPASKDFSSNWAKNLPKFVARRFAHIEAGTSSSQRRNSMADSEISFSIKHVSVESRRNSIESQVSMKIAEMKTKVARGRSKAGKFRNRRWLRRRESSTSVESHSTVFNAKTKGFKRRSGNAGLDPGQINVLFQNGLLPFLQNNNHDLEDDGDEPNSTSVQVKNIDFILKQSQVNHVEDDDDGLNEDEQREFDRLMAKSNQLHDPSYTTDDEKNMSIKQILEAATMMRADETASSRNSTKTKHSAKSIRSRKLARRSRKNSTKLVKESKNRELVLLNRNDNKEETFYNEDYDNSSLSSTYDFTNINLLNVVGGTLQSSSFSANSKATNSRNSKMSCDVGVQTNSHEIEESHNEKASEWQDSEDEERKEDCRLLPKLNQPRAVLNKPQRETLMMSESDKLKMLLLPASKCQNL